VPPRRSSPASVAPKSVQSSLLQINPAPAFGQSSALQDVRPDSSQNNRIDAKSRTQFRIALPRVLPPREGEAPAEPNRCLAAESHDSAGASPSQGFTTRPQPRHPTWNQRAPVRCQPSEQHPLVSANGSPLDDSV